LTSTSIAPGASASRAGSALSRALVLVIRHPLVRVLIRRLLLAVPLLFIVSALSFLLLSLVPGDAAVTILGNQATPTTVAALRHSLGLDLPLPERYWHWLSHALTGDLGKSLYTGETVRGELAQRLPVSLSLILGGLVVIPGVGVVLGVFSAVRGGVLGRFVDGLSLVGFALPPIVVGAVLIDVFAVKSHVFPAVGYTPLAHSPSQWLRSIALPVAALSAGGIAAFAKNTREAMLDLLASEHVRMAWARGIPAWRIFFVYVLKNVGTRVLTLTGLLTIGLLGGTVLVETIFALPGLGLLASSGASQRDVPVVQGVAVLFTLIIIGVNIVTDLAYSWLDPRVKTS
jgi:peptide/nickel transport system permease protein